jgi:hypothetical protein
MNIHIKSQKKWEIDIGKVQRNYMAEGIMVMHGIKTCSPTPNNLIAKTWFVIHVNMPHTPLQAP